jgi:hypothetical protein
VHEQRLADIIVRDCDAFAPIEVGDAAFLDGFLYRTLDVLTVPPQEALPIYSALVSWIQSAVDQKVHGTPAIATFAL